MTQARTQLWSSGGGVQSAAIAALIVQGRIAPPDLAIIVDTEREQSTTWDYCSGLLIPDTDLGENPRRERGV